MFFQIFVISLIPLYIVWFYFQNFARNRGRPPGPLRIPPFGNLIQIGLADNLAHIALHKLSKKYGDVMSIKMGLIETVVLSSVEAGRQILSKDETAGRDCTGILLDRNLGNEDIGLGYSNGPKNDETRRYCKETLNTYGYGQREVMQNMLLDEITELMKLIENESKSNPESKVHFGSAFFNGAYLNIMSALMMGKRYNYDDSEFQKILASDYDFMKNGAVGAGIMVAYPFLRFVFPKLLGYNTQMKGMREMQAVGLRFLDERKNGGYNVDPTCFTDNFLQKMDEDSQSANPLYTEEHYAVIFSDMLQAGTDTASNVLNMTLLHLVANEHIQERVFQEVSTVIGNYRLPSIEDKFRMVFTQAVILEGLRWARVLALGSPRKTLQDFSYRNFVIKKGTMVMLNNHSIFFDEDTWGDPHVFRPDRFIDLQGNIDNKKQDIVSLAFGAGKRVCFGEALGRDSLFIFITTLVQKFKFSLQPGSKPNLEPQMGLTLYTKPYDAIITVREK